MKHKLLSLLALCMIASTAFTLRAESVDDIIALSQKGTGEDVLLATVEKSKTDYNIGVADILKLKEAKVPDTVITAMLKHHGSGAAVAAPAAPAPAPAAPAPVAEQPAPAAPAPSAPVANGEKGTLELENLDNKKWAYRYEPDVKTIWIVRPTADDRGTLAATGGVTLRMNADTYKIRYSGQDRGPSVTVFAGEKSMLLLSRVDTAELEALYVSVFEHNEKKPGGRLVILRDNAGAGQAPAANNNADPKRGGEAALPPDARDVDPQIAESPTYVAPGPVYVAPPPVVYAPGYYRYPYYGPYPYSSLNFGYRGGRHSRFGVGLGFGF